MNVLAFKGQYGSMCMSLHYTAICAASNAAAAAHDMYSICSIRRLEARSGTCAYSIALLCCIDNRVRSIAFKHAHSMSVTAKVIPTFSATA
jgi:hypothetical protein